MLGARKKADFVTRRWDTKMELELASTGQDVIGCAVVTNIPRSQWSFSHNIWPKRMGRGQGLLIKVTQGSRMTSLPSLSHFCYFCSTGKGTWQISAWLLSSHLELLPLLTVHWPKQVHSHAWLWKDRKVHAILVCAPKNWRARTIVSSSSDCHSGNGSGIYF